MRVLISSMDSEVLLGNEGVLFTVDITTDDAMEAGDYTISFRNSVMSTDAAQEIIADDVDVTVTVIALAPGDANGDSKINVTDFVTTANYILDSSWTPFYFEAADLDANGTINVADLVGVANTILGISTQSTVSLHAKAASDNGQNSLYIEDFEINPGETKEIQIMLDNATAFSALQADIYMPEGLNIEKRSSGKYRFSLNPDRIEDHSVSSSTRPDGAIRILVASQGSEELYGNEGYIVSFKVTADDGFVGPHSIEMKNIVASTAQAVENEINDWMCAVNGRIEGAFAEVLGNDNVGNRPMVSVEDQLTIVHVTDDGKTIYAKDDNGFAKKDEWPYQPSASQVANNKVFDNPEKFDQSNWVALNLKEEVSSSQLEGLIGSRVKVIGILKDVLNPEIDVDEMTVESEGLPYKPNLYTIASFGEGNDYFVMPPKPQEYVSIHWAVYKDGCFYMPKSENGVNTEGLHGAVAVNTSIYEGAAFEDNSVYELTGIVKALNPRAVTSGVAIMSADVEDSEASPYYELYPITSTKTDTNPVTAINRIGIDKDDDTYYNLLGQPVSNPTPGIYIKNGRKVVVK